MAKKQLFPETIGSQVKVTDPTTADAEQNTEDLNEVLRRLAKQASDGKEQWLDL